MGDTVRRLLEDMVPELDDLRSKGIFSEVWRSSRRPRCTRVLTRESRAGGNPRDCEAPDAL
jgi:hypothetical protein